MRKRKMPLVGMIEIAQRAGVQRPTVTGWLKKPGFPPSMADLKIGPVFWWPDVKQWLDDTGRRSDCNWSHWQMRPGLDGDFHARYSDNAVAYKALGLPPSTLLED